MLSLANSYVVYPRCHRSVQVRSGFDGHFG
jgi:hypothetical protein